MGHTVSSTDDHFTKFYSLARENCYVSSVYIWHNALASAAVEGETLLATDNVAAWQVVTMVLHLLWGYAVYSLKPQSVELPPPPSPFLLQACTQMGLPEGAGSRSDGKLYELEEASIKKGNKRYVDGKIAAFQTQGGGGGVLGL